MITLRLFNADDPSRQLDSRTLADGQVRIGRDAAQDWALDDPARLISRAHLVVAAEGEAVTVTDVSSNGVLLADRDERLPRDKPTAVPLGARLRFGPYLLLIERAGGSARPARAAPAAPADAFDDGASPFSGPAAGGRAFDSPRAPDPFSSALPPDPFGYALDPGGPVRRPAGAGVAPAASEDAWGRKPERRVGDWDGGPAMREGHEHLIGSGRAWRDPPPPPAPEVGFGFDAPFSQPILRPVEVSGADLAIPSDWDQPARPAAPPPAAGRIAPPAFESEPVRPEPVKPPAAAAPTPFTAPAPEPAPAPPAPEPEPFEPLLAPPKVVSPPPEPPPPPISASAPRAAAGPRAGDRELLEAFCRGAKLDPAVFSREDPAEVMARLGGIYRQMILGMSDLLGERTSLKNEYRMVRTTVAADDNNPFKWATPQKVASQLLLAPEEGYLDGPQAVVGAFTDLKKHLLCLLAGLRAALGSTLDALAPAQAEAGIKGKGSMMKSRDAAAWAEYGRLYEAFRKEADDNPDSPVNRAFRSAYERQLAELDGMSQR